MVKQKLAVTKSAIYKRIQRLPKFALDAIENCAKGKAESLTTLFHDGIKENTLGLLPLKDTTIDTKEAMGFEQPDTPLYGLGDDADNSYANMMDVVKDEAGKRWTVKPRDAKHQIQLPDGSVVDSNFMLKDLFKVHEYGCTITNGFGKGIFIRIPPRPAFRYAYEKLMLLISKKDPAKKVRDAVTRFVRSGDEKALELIRERDFAQDITGKKKPKGQENEG